MNNDWLAHIETQLQALLALVEADRAARCAQIADEARAHTAALLTPAQAEARAGMREAFEAQRQRRRDRLAAAQAQLATRQRLHGQQRSAALLRQAWPGLHAQLLQRWQQPASRQAWVDFVRHDAQARLRPGAWRIVHAPDWPTAEQQALHETVMPWLGEAPVFAAEASIDAGLKIAAAGNVIDGTLAGLLADRVAIEARLLRLLEEPA